LTYTLAVYNNGPDVSDGDTLTDVLPANTTIVSFTNTNGTCTHPAVWGSGGTFKCTRSSLLNKGSYWGQITLTVHVNAATGSTLKKYSISCSQDAGPLFDEQYLDDICAGAMKSPLDLTCAYGASTP